MSYTNSVLNSTLVYTEYDVALSEGTVTDELRENVKTTLAQDNSQEMYSIIANSVIINAGNRAAKLDISVEEAVAVIEAEFKTLSIDIVDMEIERDNLNTIMSLFAAGDTIIGFQEKNNILSSIEKSDAKSKFRMSYSLWLLQLYIRKTITLSIDKVKELNSYLRSCDVDEKFVTFGTRVFNSAIASEGATT